MKPAVARLLRSDTACKLPRHDVDGGSAVTPRRTTTRFKRHRAATIAQIALALAAMASGTLADIVDFAWNADGPLIAM